MADLVKVLDVKANIGDAERKMGALQKSIKMLKNEKQRLDQRYKDGKIGVTRYNQSIAQNTIATKKAQMGVRQYTKSLLVNSGAMKKTSGFVMGIRKAMTGLALQFGGVMAAFMLVKNVIGIFKDFEQANADLAAVLGVSREEMSELTEDAKRLGSVTAFTATEVSQLQKEFAKLGFSTEEILDATEATLDLAAATGTDLARAAEVTGSTVRAFGLDASETQRVTDVMAKSFSSSALDMEKFATSMRSVAPVAKNAGLNIEQTTSMLGVLVDRGVDASTAGTALRNVFLELSKQGLTFEEAMKQINTSTDKNATALELFGKRGAVVGTILSETAGDIANLEEKLNNAAGAAEKMALEQLDTLAGKLTILNSAWEGLILSVEDGEGAFNQAFKLIVDGATTALGALKDLGEVGKFEAIKNLVFKLHPKAIEFQERINKLRIESKKGQEESGKASAELNAIIREGLELQEKVEKNLITRAVAIQTKEQVRMAIEAREEITGVVELGARQRLNLEISYAKLTAQQLRSLNTEEAQKEKERRAKGNDERIQEIITTEAEANKELSKAEQKELDKTQKQRDKAAEKQLEGERKNQQLRLQLAAEEAAEKTQALAKEIAENTLANESRTKAVIEQMDADADLRLLEAETLEEERLAIIEKENAEFQEKLNVKALRENATDEEIKLHNTKRELLQAQHTKKLENIEQKFDAIKQENRNKDLQSSANMLGVLAGLAKQGSVTQKALMSAQTLMSTYLAAQQAYTSQFIPGDPSSLPRAIIAAVTATISGLARVAAINNVKFAEGGVLNGKSHARGGIPTIDGQYEFEGGEAVINKRSTAKYGALLSQINQAGGGIPFARGGVTKFQDGGINAPISFPDTATDLISASEQLTAQMGAIKVVNVVSETTEQQNNILNVTSEAEMG